MYEYTATLPASVENSATLTVTGVRADAEYEYYSISIGEEDFPVAAFSNNICSAYTTAGEFREATGNEISVGLRLTEEDEEPIEYSIVVSVEQADS